MKILTFVFACLFCLSSLAEEQGAVKAILLDPEKVSEKEKFTWNKWETENFIVLSIDKEHGLEFRKKIESIKDSHFEKWGLKESKLKTKCKIICVRDSEMLKRFFGIESPRAESKRGSSGSISTSAIWIDYKRSEELPSLVAFICSSESGDKWYVQRGVCLLSLPSERIKSELAQASALNFSEIFACDSEKWLGFSPEDRAIFDRKSAMVCLMLRREFGQERFLEFLSSEQDQNAIKTVYGFSDLPRFDETLNRYCRNLSADISRGITPDSYLKVQGAKK